jgi:hypothetical protein
LTQVHKSTSILSFGNFKYHLQDGEAGKDTHVERPQTSQVKRPSRSSSVSSSGDTPEPKNECPVVKAVYLQGVQRCQRGVCTTLVKRRPSVRLKVRAHS